MKANLFKKAFMLTIGAVFGIVAISLDVCAKVFHVTYNTVNVVVYYFLIPLSWAILLDRCLSLPYTTTVLCIGVWIGITLVTLGRFQRWCDYVFDKSVEFLLWFERVGWNYCLSSVIICVIVPIAVYAVLLMLNIR